MNEQDSEFNERSPRAVHVFIAASVAVTVLAAGLVAAYHDSPLAASLLKSIGMTKEQPTVQSIALELLKAVQSADEATRTQAIKSFVAKSSPGKIAAVVAAMLAQKDAILAGPLALEIAENGALRYKSARLYLLIANEYITGKYVSKNLPKAKMILENPLLQAEVLKDLYLGNYWSDDQNIEKDLEKAKYFYTKSAKKGNLTAKSLLEKFSQQ